MSRNFQILFQNFGPPALPHSLTASAFGGPLTFPMQTSYAHCPLSKLAFRFFFLPQPSPFFPLIAFRHFSLEEICLCSTPSRFSTATPWRAFLLCAVISLSRTSQRPFALLTKEYVSSVASHECNILLSCAVSSLPSADGCSLDRT